MSPNGREEVCAGRDVCIYSEVLRLAVRGRNYGSLD